LPARKLNRKGRQELLKPWRPSRPLRFNFYFSRNSCNSRINFKEKQLCQQGSQGQGKDQAEQHEGEAAGQAAPAAVKEAPAQPGAAHIEERTSAEEHGISPLWIIFFWIEPATLAQSRKKFILVSILRRKGSETDQKIVKSV
jgi:hypothetical protein